MHVEKLMFACRALDQIGNPTAFSLNLNHAVAERASSDPQWLRRSIVRAVGSSTPLVLAFGCADGRLHLHGAFSARPDQYEAVMAGLESAAGPWASNRGDAYQLVARPMIDADGWARYMLRNVAEAKDVDPARSWWSMTNPTRRAAKQLHAAVRQSVNAASRGARP